MSKKIEKLSSFLGKTLASHGLATRLKEFRVMGRWEKIVGKVIARHAQPSSLRGKKLSVVVDSSAWMQQLSLLKPELIEKLNQGLGAGSLHEITLKIGTVAPGERPELERAKVLSVGWSETDTDPDSQPTRNYWRVWAEPVDLGLVVACVVETTAVYGDDPDSLTVATGTGPAPEPAP